VSYRRSKFVRAIRRIVRDERGGEMLEYALVAGLIVLGAVAAIRALGQQANWGWGYISSKL
jgi:Flp pilus assembly pilin Flp